MSSEADGVRVGCESIPHRPPQMTSWFSRFFRNRADAPVQTGRSLPSGAFRNAVSLQTGDQAPEWIRIVPIGLFPTHHDGPHEITADHVGEMFANFARTSTDVLVDLEHGSLWGESRAAGWSDAVEVRDDGLYMRFPEWTPYGDTFVAAREYRYLSPVYQLTSVGKDGSERGARLISVGLTNSPYMDEGEVDPIRNSNPTGSEPGDPNPTPTTMSEALRNRLIKLYGLAADATDEQIEAATEKAEADAEAAAADEAKAKADADAKAAEEAKADETLQQRVDRLEKEAKDREKATTEAQVETLVNSAVQRGAILPADKDLYLNSARHDFGGTKAKLDAKLDNAALPGRVRVNSQRQGGGANPTPSQLGGMTGSARTSTMDYVNKQFGNG